MERKPHHRRLQSAIEWDYRQLAKDRWIRDKLIRAFAGSYYGPNHENASSTPVNFFELFVTSLSSYLAGGEVRALATTAVGKWKPYAEDVELATNRRAVKSGYSRILNECVVDSFFGLAMLAIAPTSRREVTGTGDWMEPTLDIARIDAADAVFDSRAASMEDADYVGRRIFVPLVDSQDDPLFDEKARGELKVSSSSPKDGDQDDETNISTREWSPDSEYIEYVELWEIFSRRENRVIVWAKDQPELILRDEPWTGADGGPFIPLYYRKVPNHASPKAPLADLYKLHMAGNALMTKAIHQQQKQKNILHYSSADEEAAKRVVMSLDGDSQLRDTGQVEYVSYGGADQRNVAMADLCKMLFSYFGGNLDALAGLGLNAETATESRLLTGAASKLITSMQKKVFGFAKRGLESIYHYEMMDSQSGESLQKRIPGTQLNIDVDWTPEKREWLRNAQYEIDVDPYSLPQRGPDDRLADLMSVLNTVAMPLMPFMQQQGAMLDIRSIFDTIGKYRSLPEIQDWIVYGPPDSGAERMQGAEQAPKPNMPHRYVRESVSAGAGKEQAIMQAMKQGAVA